MHIDTYLRRREGILTRLALEAAYLLEDSSHGHPGTLERFRTQYHKISVQLAELEREAEADAHADNGLDAVQFRNSGA